MLPVLLSCLPYILFSVGMCVFVNWILLMLHINKAVSQSNLRLFIASTFLVRQYPLSFDGRESVDATCSATSCFFFLN